MRTRTSVSLILAVMLLSTVPASAQFIEDALRMAEPPDAVSARSAAMGNAFVGVADDFSAIFWNPAGLGQLRANEFALGLSNLRVSNDASYLGASSPATENSFHLSGIGMALPFPVARGSLVFAGGYQRLVNFARNTTFGGFNAKSSIMPTLFDADDRYDLTWNLNLQDTALTNPTYLRYPIRNNVQQEGEIFESGNLGMWSFGGSMEVAPDAFVGAAINVVSGSYMWDRTFIETDPSGLHANTVIPGKEYDATGFERLTVEENLDQSISGWNAKLGFLYRYKELVRFGAAIQTPTMVTVSETYLKNGQSDFRDAQGPYSYTYKLPTQNAEYDVNTDWVFSLGASVRPVDVVNLSADIEICDYSNLEFDNTSIPDLVDLNKDIRKNLRQTTNYRVGAEVRIPQTNLFLRGGFRYQFSPYVADENTTTYDVKTFSGGLGYMFDDVLMLNLTVVHSAQTTFTYAYVPSMAQRSAEGISPSSFTLDQDITRTWLMLSVGYAF